MIQTSLVRITRLDPERKPILRDSARHLHILPAASRDTINDMLYQSTPYTEEHERFRTVVRKFREAELLPHADAWEKDELSQRRGVQRRSLRAARRALARDHQARRDEQAVRRGTWRARSPIRWFSFTVGWGILRSSGSPATTAIVGCSASQVERARS